MPRKTAHCFDLMRKTHGKNVCNSQYIFLCILQYNDSACFHFEDSGFVTQKSPRKSPSSCVRWAVIRLFGLAKGRFFCREGRLNTLQITHMWLQTIGITIGSCHKYIQIPFWYSTWESLALKASNNFHTFYPKGKTVPDTSNDVWCSINKRWHSKPENHHCMFCHVDFFVWK